MCKFKSSCRLFDALFEWACPTAVPPPGAVLDVIDAAFANSVLATALGHRFMATDDDHVTDERLQLENSAEIAALLRYPQLGNAGLFGPVGPKLRVWTPREMQVVFYGLMRDAVEFQRVSGLRMQQLWLRALMDIRGSDPNRFCAHESAYSFTGFSNPVILDFSPIILR